MLTFEEFVRSTRCKPLILADEDQPQDMGEWKRMEREDQREQYDRYLRTFEGEPYKPVAQPIGIVAKHVAQHDNGARKSRAEYFRAYRRRPKKCRHCGGIL